MILIKLKAFKRTMKVFGNVYIAMSTSLEIMAMPDNTWRPNIFQSNTIVVFVRQLALHIKHCPCTFLEDTK